MYLANALMGSKVYLERSSFIHLLAVTNKLTYLAASQSICTAMFPLAALSPLILSNDRFFTITRIHRKFETPLKPSEKARIFASFKEHFNIAKSKESKTPFFIV